MILISMSKPLRHSTHRSLTSRLSCKMRACSSATSLNLILESTGTFSARLSKLIAPKAAMAAAANLEQKYTGQELISKGMQLHYILIDWFIFRPNFAGMRLPSGFHDQSHETNSRHYVTEPELPFFHNRRGILKINQSVKMPWHRLGMRAACSYSSSLDRANSWSKDSLIDSVTVKGKIKETQIPHQANKFAQTERFSNISREKFSYLIQQDWSRVSKKR